MDLQYIPVEFLSRKVCTEAIRQNRGAIRFIPKSLQNIEQSEYICKKLPPNTECLIMGDAIGVGDYYKLCTVKCDHIISFESWLKIDAKQCNKCCYCKGNLLEEIFCNED